MLNSIPESSSCIEFLYLFQNLSGHNAIVNCMAVNGDGVLVSGADNGTMHFWDWTTGERGTKNIPGAPKLLIHFSKC